MAPPKKKSNQTAVAAKSETEVKKKRATYARKNDQGQPKAKKPTLLRIKLPNLNPECLQETTKKSPTLKKSKLLSTEAKIQMANEVLQTILNRKSANINTNFQEPAPSLPPINNDEANVETAPVPKRRGRKKKIVETKPNPKISKVVKEEKTEEAVCEDLSQTIPKIGRVKKKSQKTGNKVVKKETRVPKEKKTIVRKRKVVDKTNKTPVKKSARIQTRNKNDETNNQAINDIAVEIENNICNKTNSICIKRKNVTNNISNLEVKQLPKQPIPNIELSDNSRRTSMSSNCLSWTKDISSSSTTTCLTVKSDDFFRIDNKLPILELDKVDKPVEQVPSYSSSSDSDSSSTSSDITNSETVTRSEINPTPVINQSSPNLSISSKAASESSPIQHPNKNTDIMDFEIALQALDKVKLMMNKYNLEILNWIAYPDNYIETDSRMTSRRKIIDQLKQENDIVRLCEQFEDKIIKKNNVEPRNVNCNGAKDSLLPGIEKLSSTYTDKLFDFQDVSDGDFSDDEASTNANDEKIENREEPREIPNRTQYNNNYVDEDDDALSLFAEGSITGGESYRHSSIISAVQSNKETQPSEEYIPQPISSQIAQSASYKPSKIVTNEDTVDTQNVVSKPTNNVQHKVNLFPHINRLAVDPNRSSFIGNNPKPLLMASIFNHNKKFKSLVFKDVCFFNLVGMCKRENCGFPHVTLDAAEVKSRLTRLREDTFIREYILIRNWGLMRRVYGLCYVQECCKRELTHILIEMAIDFGKHMHNATEEEATISVEVFETVLLHLNNVDLRRCKKLLNYSLVQGVQLCDSLMHAIAVTQNFSRFKSVFINLTNFIEQQNKSFSQIVADNMIERLSILPIEVPVARALLTILKNTDTSVLKNPRLSQFEAQLLKLDNGMYNEVQILKMHAKIPASLLNFINTQVSPEAELPRQDSYSTQETPHQDSLNQTTDQETPKRTPPIFKVTNKFANTSSSSSDDANYRQPQNERFTNYRDNFKPPSFERGRGMPRMLRGVKRRYDQRNITFAGKIPKYPRRF